MKKIRFGIIGFGAFAERAILPAIRESRNAEITAIQKRSIEEAKKKASEYSVSEYYDSPEKLAASENVDAVFIVSANSAHCNETIIAANAKKHVLVEKPMAINTAEAQQMIDACNNNNVTLMVGHMLRFSPLLKRIKQIIESGELGEISFARAQFVYDVRNSKRNWVTQREFAGGGPLFDIGVHCLDAIRFVLDDEVVAVKHLMRPKPSAVNTELTSLLSLEFSDGALASIHTSYEPSYRQSYIEFIGSKGTISAYNFTPSNVETTIEVRFGDGFHSYSTRVEKFSIPNLYVSEIEHFAECILTNTLPIISNDGAYQNQRILELAITHF